MGKTTLRRLRKSRRGAVEEAVHAAAGSNQLLFQRSPHLLQTRHPYTRLRIPTVHLQRKLSWSQRLAPPTPAVETEEAKEANPADILGAAAGGSVEDAATNFSLTWTMSEISTSSEESG